MADTVTLKIILSFLKFTAGFGGFFLISSSPAKNKQQLSVIRINAVYKLPLILMK